MTLVEVSQRGDEIMVVNKGKDKELTFVSFRLSSYRLMLLFTW